MGEGVRQWTVSVFWKQTKKKAGLCLAYSTHATGFLVFLLLLKSLLLLLLLLHASQDPSLRLICSCSGTLVKMEKS
ncbi:hypothetical protein V6Z11_D13G217600 [Gossypium hirsutum]